jgi:hypothetical protein
MKDFWQGLEARKLPFRQAGYKLKIESKNGSKEAIKNFEFTKSRLSGKKLKNENDYLC